MPSRKARGSIERAMQASAVVMLVSNDVTRDQRVWKEAKTLQKGGYALSIVALKSPSTPAREVVDGVDIKRVHSRVAARIRATGERLLHPDSKGLASDFLGTETSSRGLRAIIRRILSRVLRDSALLVMILLRDLAFMRHVIGRKAEIVHAHDLDVLLPAWVMARVCKAKLVYDSHELWTEMGDHCRWFRLFWRLIESRLVLSCDAVITVCDSIALRLASTYRISQPSVVRNCPYTSRFSGAARGESVAGKEPCSCVCTQRNQEPLRFIYQGSFVPMRGLEQLIEAFALVKRDSVLELQGFGRLERRLRCLIEHYGVAHRVSIIPPVEPEALVESARRADVGVVPFLPLSLNNKLALPNKVFEYMMGGLALCVSDITELAKLVYSQRNGVLFDPFSPGDLAAKIDQMSCERHRTCEMGRRSREAALRDYNWEKEQEILLDVYATLRSEKR